MSPPLPSAPLTLAVVVPTRGDHQRLRVTLASLAGQTDAPAHEVIVVDDSAPGGGPALAEVLAEARDRLPLRVVPGPRQGRAAVRNAGAGAAATAWVLFLDADVVVGPRFLRAYADAARPGFFLHGLTRELPAAARLLATLEGASWPELQRTAAELTGAATDVRVRDPLRRTMANALERAIEAMDAGTLPDVAAWLGFVGANSAVEKEAWRSAGGFDEEFGRDWGCEDIELGVRLHGAGLRRALVPEAYGIHLSHARPGRWQQHGRNMERFAMLHPLPAVRALTALLGPDGTPERYVAAVRAEAARPRLTGSR
ncbi:glycosyltransferase family 2 protein [Streptomyces pacificus]|uniref:Glycosyltransferase n=1 Tax=Streptomyces pacificus TaxID=2705029 RepID=A0A6A0AZ60_9ACTN|nr:glycosyltransferase family 2 protein [Streptomyces pacificus]GFH38239.1 glycosyltransferase [Streptomyces pacificus]